MSLGAAKPESTMHGACQLYTIRIFRPPSEVFRFLTDFCRRMALGTTKEWELFFREVRHNFIVWVISAACSLIFCRYIHTWTICAANLWPVVKC